jgi:hypothetical protein
LANSIKHSDRCIAGVEVEKLPDGKWKLSNNWIRPVSNREKNAINAKESCLDNNSQPSVLDIIEISLSKSANVAGQPEDWIIDPISIWKYLGRIPRESLNSIIESPKNLWLEYPHNPFSPDRVSPDFVKKHVLPSLYLIKSKDLQIAIAEKWSQKKRRAIFTYQGIRYDLALTDPEIQRKFFSGFPLVPTGPIAKGPAPDSILCVSLAPEWNGKHYKLIAAVI